MKMKTKLEFALGIAKKAGCVLASAPLVCEGARDHKLSLVLLAQDASLNTKKKITNTCAYYKVKLYNVGLSMLELSDAVGCQRLTAAVGIKNHSVSRLVNDALQAESIKE